MNVPQTEIHDPETGEIRTGLPAHYEVENQSLAVSLARAEVDQQIATARALPRHPSRVVQSILSLATLDEKSAEECVYALPRGGKPIKGPSIRLAEIISSQWGNCRVGARVVHVDRIEKYVEAEGVFHDLETNTATTARVRRRISDKNGRVFNDDMITVTGNAACSIAKRNAILGGVPKAVWRRAYDAVESVIAGDATTLVERRDKAMKAFAAFGVSPERICEGLGVADKDDITLEHMPILMGAHSALKNGEATVEELFPAAPKEGDKPASTDLTERLNALAGGKADGKKEETKAKPKADVKEQQGEKEEPRQTTKQKSEPDNASSSGSDEGGNEAAEPSSGDDTPAPDGGDSVAAARRAGAEARHAGMSRKAVPAEFRDEPALSAYLDGFDTGEAEDREPGMEG